MMETFASFIAAMNRVFIQGPCDFELRRVEIEKLLDALDLLSSEVERFAFWDETKAYTRNLVHTNKNFSVLMLCWSPGKESKVHNHPCQGCFSKR